MKLRSPWRRWWPVAAVVASALIAATTLLVANRSSDDALVVYNGRSHYGGEGAFTEFTKATGIKVKLFGGDAETLQARLKSEGKSTKADLLITVDGANLSRAKRDGLLLPVRSTIIEQAVPAELRDPDGAWTSISTRVRTIMRSENRVPADAVTTYADLGNPRWKGRVCLRSANSIYNQSFVADMIAKQGSSATEQLLRSWMANEPRIVGNDVQVLKAIDKGQCDLGLANSYYLARVLKDNGSFPVTPAWPEQQGVGAHANLSGAGVVAATDRRADAVRLLEFLVQRKGQAEIAKNGEFPANPSAAPIPVAQPWRNIKIDPIDAAGAADRAADAVALMQKVGWE